MGDRLGIRSVVGLLVKVINAGWRCVVTFLTPFSHKPCHWTEQCQFRRPFIERNRCWLKVCGNFSDTFFSHQPCHRTEQRQSRRPFSERNRCWLKVCGNFSDTFFSHHPCHLTEQCHKDSHSKKNWAGRMPAPWNWAMPSSESKAKKILSTIAKDLSIRQNKSFSQKDESQ